MTSPLLAVTGFREITPLIPSVFSHLNKLVAMRSRHHSTDKVAVNLSSWLGGGRQMPAITLETSLLARVAPGIILELCSARLKLQKF